MRGFFPFATLEGQNDNSFLVYSNSENAIGRAFGRDGVGLRLDVWRILESKTVGRDGSSVKIKSRFLWLKRCIKVEYGSTQVVH